MLLTRLAIPFVRRRPTGTRSADSTVTRAPGTTLAALLRSQPACSRRNAGPVNSATHTIMSFRSRFTWRTAVFGPGFGSVSMIVVRSE
ncbi:polysaccharide deacetylase family protein, partial [Burkholderia pseudomallei]